MRLAAVHSPIDKKKMKATDKKAAKVVKIPFIILYLKHQNAYDNHPMKGRECENEKGTAEKDKGTILLFREVPSFRGLRWSATYRYL